MPNPPRRREFCGGSEPFAECWPHPELNVIDPPDSSKARPRRSKAGRRAGDEAVAFRPSGEGPVFGEPLPPERTQQCPVEVALRVLRNEPNSACLAADWLFAKPRQFFPGRLGAQICFGIVKDLSPVRHDFTRKAGMMAQCTRGTLLIHLYLSYEVSRNPLFLWQIPAFTRDPVAQTWPLA
jgi:hypothetical protein